MEIRGFRTEVNKPISDVTVATSKSQWCSVMKKSPIKMHEERKKNLPYPFIILRIEEKEKNTSILYIQTVCNFHIF